MNMKPFPSPYRADPQIASLGAKIGDAVRPANFPETILRFRNDRWAATVGLADYDDAAWVRHFGRFEPLPDNMPEPLALRYHGHQFRVYNPDIGDGRGFLFAQMRDGDGRLLDLATKGSGITPYSRRGDGRLTLKGGVREILATEMLEALGVNTSKTFSIIETGEQLIRGDEPSPTRSAVMVRLSHSHIRIGSFQRVAAEGDAEFMQQLIAYCLTQLYDVAPAENSAAQLLGLAVERVADLAASYMVAGFVHGVLNTDNINSSSVSRTCISRRSSGVFSGAWALHRAERNWTGNWSKPQNVRCRGRKLQSINSSIFIDMASRTQAKPPANINWPLPLCCVIMRQSKGSATIIGPKAGYVRC